MLVSELIAKLQKMPQDAEVMFQYNYGDYWRTNVAATVEEVEELPVAWSEYHRMHKVIDEYDREEEEGQKMIVVVW